jgi:3'-phosphoadenosine 5'-phosphosulfate sulfotransferase (PAPS reductase)/FAD synthetase
VVLGPSQVGRINSSSRGAAGVRVGGGKVAAAVAAAVVGMRRKEGTTRAASTRLLKTPRRRPRWKPGRRGSLLLLPLEGAALPLAGYSSFGFRAC